MIRIDPVSKGFGSFQVPKDCRISLAKRSGPSGPVNFWQRFCGIRSSISNGFGKR